MTMPPHNPQGFDAYHKWLGIPPSQQPPDHYRLLGIVRFEQDPDVIASAADRQAAHVRSHQLGGHKDECEWILNEIATARVCLLDASRKKEYDKQLKLPVAVVNDPRWPPSFSESRQQNQTDSVSSQRRESDTPARRATSPDSGKTAKRPRRQHARRKKARSHNLRLVVPIAVSASAAIILLLLFLLQQPTNNSTPIDDSSRKVTSKKPKTKQLGGVPWWDDTLRIALARLRVTRPDLRPTLDDLNSPQATRRGQAYEKLVSQLARSRRDDLQQLLISLYATESSDAAAHALAAALLADMLPLAEGLPENRETTEAIFSSCQVAAAMLKHPSTPALRRNRLKRELDAATLATGDLLLDTEKLQRLYEGALAQQLYQLLTRAAADNPDLAAQLYGTIYSAAQSRLDSVLLDQLDVGFLAAVLPAIDNKWDRYGDAIRRASVSSDPNTVIKLLSIYRRATDDRLRNYLAGLFFDRLGAAPGTLTESEMIDSLRESLG